MTKYLSFFIVTGKEENKVVFLLCVNLAVILNVGIKYFDKVEYIKGGTSKQLGVELHSGKNRIVRRTFEALGYEVVKLDRVLFAGLTKKDLPRDMFRHLTEKEVAFLKMS